MKIKTERILAFISKESFLAFALYLSFIATLTNLPILFKAIVTIIQMYVFLLFLESYMQSFSNNIVTKKIKIMNAIRQEAKKIGKELLMFIPVYLVSICFINFFMIGEPVNQTDVNNMLKQTPIYSIICIVIIGPIIEEFIFRFLPSKFIKNPVVYVIVSAFVFAGAHIINDVNPFYYIWFYMIDSLYYGYRYYKTKDIWVTATIHSFNNIIATIVFYLLL